VVAAVHPVVVAVRPLAVCPQVVDRAAAHPTVSNLSAAYGQTAPRSPRNRSANYRWRVQSDVLVDQWLTVPDAADLLGTDVGKVRQLIRDRRLIALRRGDPSRLEVPAAFIQNRAVVKGLPGLLTVLADAGYDDEASVRWLFTPDDSLPGTPVQALAANRGTEVKRRAQALAF
jgi:hypothetical protein